MRKYFFLVLSFLAVAFYSNLSNAQLVINGGTFFVGSGAVVTVQGDLTSNVDIQGTGKILLKGSTNQNVNMGGFTIPNLEMDNTANATLTGNTRIGTSMLFTNGKIQNANFNFILASAATITGASSSNFIVTNGTGKVTKEQLTTFAFPVGAVATSYTPVTVTNSGAVDDISVRAGDNVLTNGLSGSPVIKEVVDAEWEVTEAVAGGSNLSLTTSWNLSDELIGFDRTKSGLSFYDGIGWDLTNALASAASGSNPYSFTRGTLVPGVFAVGRRPVMTKLLFAPTVFLQGPYNVGTHLMNDNLRAAIPTLIPASTPYDALPSFTVLGSGGGETIDPTVLNVTGNNAIIDWVFAQLHDGSTGNVISTRSALIQADGDVVETDGTTPLNFAGFLGGSYFVSIKHRNHLGVRTASTSALARTTATTYNFTTSQSQAFAGVVSNPAMATLEATVFGMYGGNANSDDAVKKIGSASTNDYSILISAIGTGSGLLNVYRREDFNMDGNVKKTGSASSNDYSKLLSILGTSTIITQPAF